ncbi:MAG TPA: MFS transporter [Beijerinckiaceae bacterium]|jgi:MFS family permease|nr:MFS transporter [Beijerinckiaceae bacterium]
MTALNDQTYAQAQSQQEQQGITRLQWLVLWSAFLGWLFDSMDLNLFTLVLFPSVAELTGSRDPAYVAQIGGYIIALKLFCWGLGGIAFGVAADRIGRTKTMVITILIYAIFTGLSGLAQTWHQLAILQAIAGFGIGGEWAAGAALVAETWPEKHRARAMQIMQMAFAFGFFAAALDNLILGQFSWRWVIAMGAVPALIALAIRWFVPEPERWVQVRNDATVAQMTASQTFATIFSPQLRRRTIVGVLVSAAMMIGSWGGLTLLPSWIQQLVHAAGGTTLTGVNAISYAFMLMMAGAVLGYLSLIFLTDGVGRRMSYFIFCLGSILTSLYLFTMVKDLTAMMWTMPVYGFFVIGGFGTFAAYLPELYPTRVRASGQGFCWNFARLVTAIGPLIGGVLVGTFGSFPAAAASTVGFFAIGLVAIWFGPETRGVPLSD